MPETKKKVQTYRVDYRCDICGEGFYRPTGEVYPAYPMRYAHKCNKCGAQMVVTGRTYPYILEEDE